MVRSFYRRLLNCRLQLLHAWTWTALLTITVAVASFSPEMAFVSATTPSSAYSRSCDAAGFIRIPLDLPGERFCFSPRVVKRSGSDILIPTVFAGLIVASSAILLRSVVVAENDPSSSSSSS
ncbi:hypothetical protein Dimus_009093 [Dionaea muscipula]